MHCMIYSVVLTCLFAAVSPGQTPPSVDDLLSKLDDKQKQRAVLAKEVGDLVADITEKLKAQKTKLEELTNSAPAPVIPPNDPLKAKIAAAFAADAGVLADKKADAVKLAGVYSAAKELKPEENTKLATVGDLIAIVRAISLKSLAVDKLPGVRKVISDELAAALKSATDPMDKAKWDAAIAVFARIEASLDAVIK